jgi:hypothetical protein
MKVVVKQSLIEAKQRENNGFRWHIAMVLASTVLATSGLIEFNNGIDNIRHE